MANYKALTQQMYDSMVPGADVDAVVDRYMAEDFVENEVLPGMDSTRETARQMFMMLFAAMPDFHVTVHDMLQDEDKVAVRATFSGTHQGDFMGVPASGNRVEWPVIDILQFRDDKAVAHWGVMDLAAAMSQMGAAPSQT
jgi:steroid delta-isomerase-like uncharacterized protein